MLKIIGRILKATVGVYFIIFYLFGPAIGIGLSGITAIRPIVFSSIWFIINSLILSKVITRDEWEEYMGEWE